MLFWQWCLSTSAALSPLADEHAWGRVLLEWLCSEWFKGCMVWPCCCLAETMEYKCLNNFFGGKLSVMWLQSRWQDAAYRTWCILWRWAAEDKNTWIHGSVVSGPFLLTCLQCLFLLVSLLTALIGFVFVDLFPSHSLGDICFLCILPTLSFSGFCRGAASRFMMSTAGIMRRRRGCCWSSIRSGACGHVYWWEV